MVTDGPVFTVFFLCPADAPLNRATCAQRSRASEPKHQVSTTNQDVRRPMNLALTCTFAPCAHVSRQPADEQRSLISPATGVLARKAGGQHGCTLRSPALRER